MVLQREQEEIEESDEPITYRTGSYNQYCAQSLSLYVNETFLRTCPMILH